MAFFDTQNEKADTGFEVLADGQYQAMILGMTYKATKAGTGFYLAGTFLLVGGPADGRKIFHNFNIENQNDVAQRIGRGQFKQLLSALGITQTIETPDQAEMICQDKYLTLQLTSEKDRRDDKLKNVIKKFLPASAGTKVAPKPLPNDADIPF
jgi:hypothetical protein